MSIEAIVKNHVNEALNILKAADASFANVVVHEVGVSAKMSRSLGIAKRRVRYSGTQYSITISSKIFKADSAELRETVFHEVAHVADSTVFDNMSHGPTWAAIMRLLGMKPTVYASKAKLDAVGYVYEKRKTSYHVVACNACGQEYRMSAARMAKLSNYRCRSHTDAQLVATGKIVKI